jgi:hypothetical protein
MGRFENFERCRQGGQRTGTELVGCLDSSVPSHQQFRVRPWVHAFEGRLKVPGTPLHVGFNANGGQGRDDLRFVFGTLFDIGNVYRRLRSNLP